MTKRYLLSFFLLSGLILSGCGGGGGASVSGGPSGAGAPSGGLDSGTGPTGKIELSIEWPQTSKKGKFIPASTERVEVWVNGDGLPQPLFQSVARSQMQNNQAVISFPSVPVGNKVVEVKALDSANTIVAHRIKSVSVTSGQQTQVSAPLGMTATDQGFLPYQFFLNKGETIILVNGGQLNHSVVKGSDGSAISGVLAPGGSYTLQANSPGTHNFRCGIHPNETGVLFVQFPPSTITSISPLTGPSGSTLTIAGTNFGAEQMGGTGVTIGGVYAPATQWSDTQIKCTVPGGTGATNGNVTVTVAGNPVTASDPFAAMPVVEWTDTKDGPASLNDDGNAIAVDSSGNVYVAGSLTVGAGDTDIWVRKYDPSGNIMWTSQEGGSAISNDEARAVAVDGSGNVYAAGFINDSALGQQIWARKLNSTGGVLWTRTYGVSSGNDFGNAIAVDGSGNVYVAGGEYSTSNSNMNISVRKFDTNGTPIWNKDYGYAFQDDQATGIAVDASQNVYVAGWTTDSPNWTNIWVRKCDPSGNEIWTRTETSPSIVTDQGQAIRIDPSGNIYVAGFISGSAYNIWVRKYDGSGNTLWTQLHDSPANADDVGNGIAVDVFGNVYVTGYENRSDLSQNHNMWTRKYSPGGATIWTETYNGPADSVDRGNAITVDGNGNVYLAGSSVQVSAQIRDIWVRKYKQ